MELSQVHEAVERAGREVSRTGGRLDIRSDGGRVVLYTGIGTVRRSRFYAYCAGAFAVVAGIGLLWITGWALLLVACGVLVLTIGPRHIQAARLLELDYERGQLIVTQYSLGPGTILSLDRVRSIRGKFDTKGWDGYSVIYAEADDGSETPIMMLMGADEQFAELVCRVLGALLDRPSNYAGAFGNLCTCFTPQS